MITIRQKITKLKKLQQLIFDWVVKNPDISIDSISMDGYKFIIKLDTGTKRELYLTLENELCFPKYTSKKSKNKKDI